VFKMSSVKLESELKSARCLEPFGMLNITLG
jgi:hypothetical protein